MRIFLETEMFDSLGGWIVETQCREAMGSFWIFAHGCGRPVADASTAFTTEKPAEWHIFVRTRDWTAVWKRGTPAGRFNILFDGVPQNAELGTNGPEWGWQSAGSVRLEAGTHNVALHDLTGFDGRCDAVYLTDEANDVPPNGRAELDIFRRQFAENELKEDPVQYDLIVCGGGYAGLCAGLSAKKSGLRILVVQDRPVVGGCGSSEVRVWTGGLVNTPPYPRLGNVASTISPVRGQPGMKKDFALFEDDRKTLLFEKGVDLLLNEAVIAVETDPADPKLIRSVITRSVRTGQETRRFAKLFTDATGDAFLARQTGCEIMYGTEGRAEYNEFLAPDQPEKTVMGHSTLWETRELDHPVPFPDIDWGIEFNDENALQRFDCCWDWETGQFRDQVKDIEFIRDYGLMTCFANWSFLKNHSARRREWANMDLEWISAIGGKRESCRVKGELVLTQNDVLERTPYDDGTGSMTWSIDLHYADPENQRKFGEAFQSCAYHLGLPAPYPVPYRCLIAKDVKNLFLGGRCLSMTHIAFSSVRVMRTLGMLGEVIGMAAAVCRAHDCLPKAVYTDHLDDLKKCMTDGINMTPPCSWGAGHADAYHFMRPVGMYGNPTENCWIHYDRNGDPTAPVPDGLQKAIDDLGVSRKPYADFEK